MSFSCKIWNDKRHTNSRGNSDNRGFGSNDSVDIDTYYGSSANNSHLHSRRTTNVRRVNWVDCLSVETPSCISPFIDLWKFADVYRTAVHTVYTDTYFTVSKHGSVGEPLFSITQSFSVRTDNTQDKTVSFSLGMSATVISEEMVVEILKKRFSGKKEK